VRLKVKNQISRGFFNYQLLELLTYPKYTKVEIVLLRNSR